MILHLRSYRSQSLNFETLLANRFLIVVLLSLFFTHPLIAQQQDSTQIKIDDNLEQLLEEFDGEESDLSLEDLLELLQNLAENPLNINRAGIDELVQIPGINFRLAQNIVQYRSENPPFENVEDLIAVSGIGNVTLQQIRPFLRISSGTERSRDLYRNPRYWTNNGRFEGFSRFQQTVEEQYGYQRPDSLGGFVGSPVKYYQRFRYSSNHLSINLTQEKDPGEPLQGPTDFDYNSWHVALTDNGRLKSLIIGDYSTSFGQGLLLWSGGAFGKGSQVIRTPIKNERGIRPFTSAQEMIGFRGVAATYGERLQITGFYSNRKRTASEIDETAIRFPTETGYHRTLNERNRRLNIQQKTFGGRIRYQLPIGFIGVSGFYNEFNRPVQQGTLPWQLYSFEGKSISGYSGDFRILTGPALIFGEAAYTQNGAFGLLVGSQFNLSSRTEAIFVYRRYDSDFQSIFGSGFGEQSGNPGNEEAFYFGLKHQITSSIHISTYIDQFRFPSPRFQMRQPSSGYDWLGRVEISPSNRFSLYALFRFKMREEEFRTTDDFGREQLFLGESKRTGARFQAEYYLLPQLRFRTRFDTVRNRSAGDSTGYGYLIFQDVRFYLFQNLRIDARYTYFDTDGFDSRVYQFENDLLYVLSNTMLFDRGKRIYALVNFSPARWLDFWLKASTTVYDNRDVISSGNLRIDGNRKSDIGFQARVRF